MVIGYHNCVILAFDFQLSELGPNYCNRCIQVLLSLCHLIFSTRAYATHVRETNLALIKTLALSRAILTLIAWQRHSHVRYFKHVLYHVCYQHTLKKFMSFYTMSKWYDLVSNSSHMCHCRLRVFKIRRHNERGTWLQQLR